MFAFFTKTEMCYEKKLLTFTPKSLIMKIIKSSMPKFGKERECNHEVDSKQEKASGFAFSERRNACWNVQ